MCEPWGSFLVEKDGTLYFKDGVLSHTKLLEEFGFDQEQYFGSVLKQQGNALSQLLGSTFSSGLTSAPSPTRQFKNRIFYQPEYNWLHRRLDDFNRHDLEDVPKQRVCQAIDSYVEERFADAEKFLKWLERGNFLSAYATEYGKLFRPRVLPKEEETLCCIPHRACQGQVEHSQSRMKTARVLQIRFACDSCGMNVTVPISEELQENTSQPVRSVFSNDRIALVRTLPTALKDLGTFADLWRDPNNRIAAWCN